MSQSAFSTIAVFAALTFLAMALAACANSERVTVAEAAAGNVAVIEEPAGLPEFHGAKIGADALRGGLPSEN
jgi:hypothetical protein